MNRKQALIVDDSKTAQYLLKRMLQQYDLTIDVAGSAEEALAYLSYNHPAVIFLDQQMTGMTGFEALKTIKANPHTALIPVIMYSSQNDDLFVSQAIALGAQGVLSKGAMHPANLQQVLERLNIRLHPPGAAQAASAPAMPDTPTAEAVHEVAPAARSMAAIEAADLDKVRAQVGRLFELHIADIKTHLNNSTQFILKRLSTSIDRAPQRDAGISASSLAGMKATIASALAAERQKGLRTNRLLLMATIGVMLGVGYLLLQMQADAESASQKVLAALEAKNADRSMMTVAALTAAPGDKSAEKPAAIRPALLQAISWAQHADFHFDYGEPPLSGARLSNLHQLVQLLADGGYRGALVVNLNFGNFCLEQDETNALRLARSDVKVSNCKMQRDQSGQFPVNDYLTLQYQSFEKNLAPCRMAVSISGWSATA
ncbi:response regulator [Janthinobacterium sp. 17J80-10]|uniref:response regulator n=1 Tax=Janthinobacterium sp. 17J80-10 TaxID=2497863 RepID=UPI0013E89DFE|nr:response regulator [Janthinobacterium sp. 17J80-10]